MIFDWYPEDPVERLEWLKIHNIKYFIRIDSVQLKGYPEGWKNNRIVIDIEDPESALLYKLTWT